MLDRLPFTRPRSLILLVGPLGLILVRPEAPGWPLLFLAGLVASKLLEPELQAFESDVRVRRLQNLLLLVVIVVLALIAPAPLLDWFLRFAVLLGLSLAFAPGEPQREWKLIVVGFLLLLISAAQTEEAIFAVPFTAFLAILPAALHDLERARLAAPTTAGAPSEAWRGVPLAALSLTLFFAIPRTSRTLVGRGLLRPGDQGTMGETLTLNSITDIKQSARVAMRVHVDGPLPGDTKWRGSAFDRFDGTRWRIGTPETGIVKRRIDARGRLRIREVPSGAPLLVQRFQLEPALATVLFAAPTVVGIESTAFVQLKQREDDLVLGYAPPITLRYTVTSVPREWVRERNATPPADRHRYLELPELSPDVHALAAEVVQGALDDRAKLEAIERFFRREFRYSLSVVRDAGRNPLEDFLLNLREGHCEFFASGMVVLARAQGIPARLVDGFVLGEYSEIASTYLVRRSDAHAWIEAYVRGEGWLPFDPTPPGEGSLPWLSRVRDALVKLWTRFVADFSLVEQRLVVTALKQGFHAAQRYRWLLLLALAMASTRWLLRRAPRPRWPAAAARRPPWTRSLQRALRRLRSLGIVRHPGETPRELAQRAAARGSLPSLQALIALHEDACYGEARSWDPHRARVLLKGLAIEISALRSVPGGATAR